jgi:hypothetical protein
LQMNDPEFTRQDAHGLHALFFGVMFSALSTSGAQASDEEVSSKCSIFVQQSANSDMLCCSVAPPANDSSGRQPSLRSRVWSTAQPTKIGCQHAVNSNSQSHLHLRAVAALSMTDAATLRIEPLPQQRIGSRHPIATAITAAVIKTEAGAQVQHSRLRRRKLHQAAHTRHLPMAAFFSDWRQLV